MVWDHRKNPASTLRRAVLSGLKSAHDLVEARVASHGHLVVLASDAGTWRWAKHKKVFQLAAIFVRVAAQQGPPMQRPLKCG